ncbi:MAG: sulfotransferase family 2 domain-containing protein [Propionicimonas sp.]|uniref:sulfotransferase family 2 domain-containing protein n=1 Tax=Propionicimonas sp. TaxID=1955623 RepID=UPI003D134667
MPVYRRDGRSVLFVHIPKTGGTSVEQLFKASGWEASYFDARYGAGTLNNLRWCGPQHMHGAVLKDLFRIDRFDLVFAVVREPVARFRSEYVWRHRKLDEAATDAATVSRWLAKTLVAYQKNPYLYDNHLRPQHEFLVPGTKVLRLEDGLGAALRDLSDAHDLGLDGEVERFKDSSAGPRKSGDVEVSAATRGMLHRFYKRDFSTFGYPKP